MTGGLTANKMTKNIIGDHDLTKYIEMIKSYGAKTVLVIDPHNVVTAPWTIFKCQFGCSSYGRNHCCPPHAPSYDKTRAILDSYSVALLFQNNNWNTTDIARRCARELYLDGFYKTIAFGSGMCRLCSECAPQNCRQPEKAIPAMEACGIDVFATARHFDLPIYTLKSPDEERNHYGLICIE